MEDIIKKIELLTIKVFETHGMDLVELKVSGHKNDVNIQIMADKPNGGINIQECAILNKSLVAAIEQESFLPPESFSLELSSPGLDRPLVTRKDFMRLKDQKLYFWLHEPLNGKKEIQGVLLDVGETKLTIEVSKKLKLEIPLVSIVKGMLVI